MSWSYEIPEEKKFTAAEVRDVVLEHVRERVKTALSPEAADYHLTGWETLDAIRMAVAKHFEITEHAAQPNFQAPNARNRLDGQVARAVKSLAEEGLLVRWSDRKGLEGRHDDVTPVGFANNDSYGRRQTYKRGVLVTTPQGLAKSREVAESVARAKAHRKQVAADLKRLLDVEWDVEARVDPQASFSGVVTYQITLSAEDAERIVEA